MDIFGLGAPELLLILVIFLLFFGKDKLPGLARSIGQAFKELKSGFSSSVTSDTKSEDKNKDASGKSS
jgi:TatA/E family protein of Tat protein translocase